MKYELMFSAKDGSRFSLLYYAFIAGGNNSRDDKTIETLRREIALMDLLWSVSMLPSGVEPNQGMREMQPGAQSVTVDQPQYALLKKYINAFVAKAATGAAREVVALVDWFDTIQPTDAPKAKSAKRSKAA